MPQNLIEWTKTGSLKKSLSQTTALKQPKNKAKIMRACKLRRCFCGGGVAFPSSLFGLMNFNVIKPVIFVRLPTSNTV